MLDENLALEVNGISKAFKHYKDDLISHSGEIAQEVFALRDVSFRLGKGEILGVLGNNGVGKSTLLKILSGLIKPDFGTIKYRGKLSSILDIGSGFHPDLSGVDNVHMVARLLGYTNQEIDRMLAEIIDFSDLHAFMQTQVKHYSSGMFMRLAFSLFTTLKSDVLIIDEVLSVGDMSFREKSSSRIKEIAASGTTIIIASHEMKTIQNLCTHGLLLEGGTVKGFDTIQNIIDKYVEHGSVTNVQHSIAPPQGNYSLRPAKDSALYVDKRAGKDNSSKVILHRAFVKAVGKDMNADMFMDDEVEVNFEYEKTMISPIILSAVIADKFGNSLISLCSYRLSETKNFIDTGSPGRYMHSVKLPKGLFNQGLFSISFYLADKRRQELARFEKLLYFKIHKSELKFGSDDYPENYSCPLFPIADWQTTQGTLTQ